MKSFALAALLLFATTATAAENCLFYVSGVKVQSGVLMNADNVAECADDGCGFTSFNPKTKERVVVAKLSSVPHHLVWNNAFEGLTYDLDGRSYHLDWKLGAAPIQLPHHDVPKRHDDPHQRPNRQRGGKIWDPESAEINCHAPGADGGMDLCEVPVGPLGHREVNFKSAAGCDFVHFFTPVHWIDPQTATKKLLYSEEDASFASGQGEVDLSTSGAFILIAAEWNGFNSIVADLDTGDIIMKAGTSTMLATWAACPTP